MADGVFNLQPFNIPTNVQSPVRTGPRMNLNFPVFTPPAASSYGSTQPMAIPWRPPDLAGALNAGLRTGSEIGATFMANRQKAQQLAAQRQAQQYAQAAMQQPGAAERMGVTMGPEGYTATVLSPAELEMKRIQILEAQTRAEEARAREAEIYGETPRPRPKKPRLRPKLKRPKPRPGGWAPTLLITRRGATRAAQEAVKMAAAKAQAVAQETLIRAAR